MQEGVGPEDSEHEPEQDSDDDDGVFHRCCLVISSVEVEDKDWLTADYADITDVQNQTVAAFVVYYAGYADNLLLQLACLPRRS